jgi:dihydroneopterin aldolase
MSRNGVAAATVLAPKTKLEEGTLPKAFSGDGGKWQRVRIDDMVIECLIGIHSHEHKTPQRVSIDIELVRPEPDDPTDEIYARVMCYETVINKIRAIASEGHIMLIETLAERIAEACQREYPAISELNVTVNKLDVFPDVAKVGVRLERIFDSVVEPAHKTRNFTD